MHDGGAARGAVRGAVGGAASPYKKNATPGPAGERPAGLRCLPRLCLVAGRRSADWIPGKKPARKTSRKNRFRPGGRFSARISPNFAPNADFNSVGKIGHESGLGSARGSAKVARGKNGHSFSPLRIGSVKREETFKGKRLRKSDEDRSEMGIQITPRRLERAE